MMLHTVERGNQGQEVSASEVSIQPFSQLNISKNLAPIKQYEDYLESSFKNAVGVSKHAESNNRCADTMEFLKHEVEPEVDDTRDEDNKEVSIEEKQEIADKAAQEYNAKTHPYERALAKGIEGVQETENGGVSFAETEYIYTKEDGTRCITEIEATGNRSKDFDAANEAMGLDDIPDGYVWHHVDDYNVKDGTITLELVKDEAHNASKPHSGGCAQFDAVNGASYNPPRKGVN